MISDREVKLAVSAGAVVGIVIALVLMVIAYRYLEEREYQYWQP